MYKRQIVGADLRKSLGNFLKFKLKFDDEFLRDMGEIAVKRVAAGPRAKIKGEVIAVFATNQIRDDIKAAARELAGDVDSGIRLEVPASLQANLKALEAVSFNMKKNYPNLKRNVRFDDEAMDLILHFCPDPDTTEHWRRLRPDQAKAMKAKMTGQGSSSNTMDVTEEDLERMMTLGEAPP